MRVFLLQRANTKATPAHHAPRALALIHAQSSNQLINFQDKACQAGIQDRETAHHFLMRPTLERKPDSNQFSMAAN
jgi:hypothetical protein